MLLKLKNIIKICKARGIKGIFAAMSEKANEYWYEKRFGLDCGGWIEIDELNKSVNDERYKNFGVVFTSAPFEWMKKGINELSIDIKNVTLLDLGSGKGRVTSYALQQGFRKVIGVEWSLELASISVSNLNKLNATCVCGGGYHKVPNYQYGCVRIQYSH